MATEHDESDGFVHHMFLVKRVRSPNAIALDWDHRQAEQMDDLRLHDFSDLSLDEGIALIEAEILDEYLQPHEYPWVIGYSGGKDSTLVAHLVF